MTNRRGLWRVAFYNKGHAPSDPNLFGCATLGAASETGFLPEDTDGIAAWRTLEGRVLAGTRREVLSAMRFERASFALVFFLSGEGADAFLRETERLLPGVRIAGGGSADGLADGELRPEGEVCVLLSDEPAWEIRSENVLDLEASFAFRANAPRELASLRAGDAWLEARLALANLKRARGAEANDFESLTFSDEAGRNLHFHEADGKLLCGADLPEAGDLVLRHTPRLEAARRIEAYARTDGALITGCAGLKSLLERPFSTGKGTLMLFLHGEIVQNRFGNLMLARVTDAWRCAR